jgi:hypothetical protein
MGFLNRWGYVSCALLSKGNLLGQSGVLYLFWNQSVVDLDGGTGYNLDRQAVQTDPSCGSIIPERSIEAYQMATGASPCLCGRWRISCAASWERASYRSQEDSKMLPSSGCWMSWTQRGAEVCWPFPLPNAFSMCHLGPSTLTALPWFHFGPFLKTKQNKQTKQTEKTPRVLFFPVNCSKESNGKQGKDYSQSSRYCFLYKCYWITRSLCVYVFLSVKKLHKCHNSENLSKYVSFLGKMGLAGSIATDVHSFKT